MEVTAEISCPWCGQLFSIQVDTGQPNQRFVTDCEVCCRPIDVAVASEPGEILGLDVQAV